MSDIENVEARAAAPAETQKPTVENKEGQVPNPDKLADIDEPKSVDQFGQYYRDLLNGTDHSLERQKEAAQKVNGLALKHADRQAIQSKMFIKNSTETVYMALGRIGDELNAGADAETKLGEIQAVMDSLLAEQREKLNALKVNAPEAADEETEQAA